MPSEAKKKQQQKKKDAAKARQQVKPATQTTQNKSAKIIASKVPNDDSKVSGSETLNGAKDVLNNVNHAENGDINPEGIDPFII